MGLFYPYHLTSKEIKTLNDLPKDSWFHRFTFENYDSPHSSFLEGNLRVKRWLVRSWIDKYCRDKTVLDCFCGNGLFSFLTMLYNPKSVVGFDVNPNRVKCARILSDIFVKRGLKSPSFLSLDVYDLPKIDQKFDVVLCFGGIYHVPDVPLILKYIAEKSKGLVILQSSGILYKERFNLFWRLPLSFLERFETFKYRAWFRDPKHEASWNFTLPCLRRMIDYAGLEILEEKLPDDKKKFPFVAMVLKKKQ